MFSVRPITGPVWGNTTVTVFGTNFMRSAIFVKCRFGSLNPVHATTITSSQLQCISPPNVASTVSVEITNNNQDFTFDGVSFTYQRMLLIADIELIT